MNERTPVLQTGYLPACIDGRTLKIIALVTMLIDHTGAALFPQLSWMRLVGRMAFPIYCFLLVEGAFYTRNIRRYLVQMFVFAAISEVPFDLALMNGRLPYMKHQNVFFTLAIGVLMIWICRTIRERMTEPAATVLAILVFCGACILAEVLEVDYHAKGILMIGAFYFFRQQPYMKYFAVVMILFYMGGKEPAAALTLLLIDMYNGKRGSQPTALKYAFYVIYPLHLTILYLIARSGVLG